METAICGRVPLSPNYFFTSKSGDKHSLSKQWTHRTMLMTVSAAAPGKGSGVLERPTIERIMPGRESEFDLR
ncbi:ATP-dependent Clp protease adapter protein CLPS1, chloroplastic [Vitis vinifera]|uniref:ATP-dependent Clp protease adapter protein CLPS1, chloroplastic n=1 Tax=Vitis vinifera TaxID=29760 RepID=A0A438JZ59_VITVI|nr:ATP-dependent Clp protease adapter protein CLPS1, chloroplastic [Vitis vinifera]